jgi:hypothetical protein
MEIDRRQTRTPETPVLEAVLSVVLMVAGLASLVVGVGMLWSWAAGIAILGLALLVVGVIIGF